MSGYLNVVALRQIEKELAALADDRDIRALQAASKIVVQLRRLVEVLVHGEPKTKQTARHHE